jgi:hypothetical protein
VSAIPHLWLLLILVFFFSRVGSKRKPFNIAAQRQTDEMQSVGGSGARRAPAGRGRGAAAPSARPASSGGAGPAGGISGALKPKKAKWKAEHEQLMAAMRAARQVSQAQAQGIDLATLPPAPSADYDDYVQVGCCFCLIKPLT